MNRKTMMVACAAVLAGSAMTGRAAANGRPCVWLSFDNPERLAADAGVLALDFAATGTLVPEARGVSGGCAFFDGKSFLAAKAVPKGFPAGAEAVSASAWVRTAPQTAPRGGWVSWGAMEKGRGNSLRLDYGHRLHNYWNNHDLTVEAPDVDDGRWHHVVAVADPAGRRAVYLDGRKCGEDAARPDTGRGILLIGSTMHDMPFKGWVDEVKIWKRAFSDDEVFALYKEELSREVLSREPIDIALERTNIAFAPETLMRDGFAITLKVDLTAPSAQEEALYAAGPVRLTLRQAGANKALDFYDRALGNYLNFTFADGSCPVLEATVAPLAGRVGLPLASLGRSEGVHEVTLRYAAAKWSICIDGADSDEDYPIPGCPVIWREGAEERVLSPRVKGHAFLSPGAKIVEKVAPDARSITGSIQYWTPPGYNTWVGDVAPAFLNGRLHVFYLLDRRHHHGGNGTGRHQFAHLSSADLVHWVEHPLAVAIREDWQTCGTGTPFLKDGKVALAFGWHTSRYPQRADKPLGGTYTLSEDGIHFRNSGLIISEAQNPSIYTLPDGSYELVTSYGGTIGIFRSKDLLDWKPYDTNLPFRGDCPSLFDWHGHRYLLQGFVNMAYSPTGKPGTFEDWSKRPDKLYDGLGVPMVAKWKDDRRLYMGWLNHVYGWGGWLVFREVVAYPDGALGLKWVPEIRPPVEPVVFKVEKGGPLAVRFAAKDPSGTALVLRVDPKARTAQFGDDRPDTRFGEAKAGHNVRIGGVRGIDGAYEVRVIEYYDAKANVTIFDAEVAGQRTLICRRLGRFAAGVRCE